TPKNHLLGSWKLEVGSWFLLLLEDDVPADDRDHRLQVLDLVLRHCHVVAAQDDHVGVLALLDRAEHLFLVDEEGGLICEQPQRLFPIDRVLLSPDQVFAGARAALGPRCVSRDPRDELLGAPHRRFVGFAALEMNSYAVFCLKKKNTYTSTTID